MSTTEQCVDCVFYDSQNGDTWGLCRFDPPRPDMVDEERWGIWPMVCDDQWCGKWKPK